MAVWIRHRELCTHANSQVRQCRIDHSTNIGPPPTQLYDGNALRSGNLCMIVSIAKMSCNSAIGQSECAGSTYTSHLIVSWGQSHDSRAIYLHPTKQPRCLVVECAGIRYGLRCKLDCDI